MPIAEMRTVYQEQRCKFDVPADRFAVNHGYKDGSCVQVRLNEDGTVYLGDSRESRFPDRYISATVPFALFAEEWPRFVEYMAAKAAEATEGEG